MYTVVLHYILHKPLLLYWSEVPTVCHQYDTFEFLISCSSSDQLDLKEMFNEIKSLIHMLTEIETNSLTGIDDNEKHVSIT